MMKPYDVVLHDGRTVDGMTKMALVEVEQHLGYPLSLTQGSYNDSVEASGGTHDGGGVIDLEPLDHERKVLELRRAGFAAYFRPELWQNGEKVWSDHIHAVQIGNRRLSVAAMWQVDEYLAGRNALANRMPDPGPRQFVHHRFSWRVGAKRISRARDLIERARAKLSVGVRGYPAVRKVKVRLGQAHDLLPSTE